MPATGHYTFLNAEPGPKMLIEALKHFGLVEGPANADNPTILAWAAELGTQDTAYAQWAAKWYTHDSTPWCGLFMAVCAQRAGKTPPEKFLSASDWATFGSSVGHAMLGDVLVFHRPGGGHVGMYVGEDDAAYHVLGGNQSDRVCITRITKDRCVAIRRPTYINQPANVRRIFLDASGGLSENEA